MEILPVRAFDSYVLRVIRNYGVLFFLVRDELIVNIFVLLRQRLDLYLVLGSSFWGLLLDHSIELKAALVTVIIHLKSI